MHELDVGAVLGSIGTVGDAYDNALAESFVDSYKTELIADRVWRSRAEVEFATVEWVAWFNHARLHGSLGDIPPAEFEALDAPKSIAPAVGRGDPVGARTTHRAPATGVDPAAHSPIAPVSAPVARSELGSGRPNSAQGTKGRG